MRLFNQLRMWWRSVSSRDRVEGELGDELRFHIEQQTSENVAAGMPPDEARRAALRSIGGLALIEEQCRDTRRTNWMDDAVKDVRLAARTLRRDFTFTLTSALTLALGIGATTAIFTVFHAVILQPLPYSNPDRLVTAWESTSAVPAKFPMHCDRFSPGNYLDLRQNNQVFSQIGGMAESNYNLTGGGDPERVAGGLASASLFPMLGVRPMLGRGFIPSDDKPSADRFVILGHALWVQRFGANPAVLGTSIRLDDNPHTIIGVMPSGFEVEGLDADVWLPLERQISPENMRWRFSYYVAVIARLKPGVSQQQARQDVDRLVRDIRQRFPDDLGKGGVVEPILEADISAVRRPLMILLGAVGFVLLIACANVANLNLAHTAGRRREIAVRLALGAARVRIVRQLFTESFLLACFGAAAGFLAATGTLAGLLKLAPGEIPRATEIHVDGWMLGFAIAAAMGTSIVFGLAPALAGSSADIQNGLRDGGRTGSPGPGSRRTHGGLVISEVALALVLMIGAGLMIESFRRLSAVDPGFERHGLLTMRLPLSETKYAAPADQTAFYRKFSERVREIKRVESFGLVDGLPFSQGGFDNAFVIENRPEPPPGQPWILNVRRIDPGYFKTMGIGLIAGRPLTESDRENTPDVAVISQSLARKYWPSENPIGKSLHIYFSRPNPHPVIVGVAADVRNRLDSAPLDIAYIPYPQGRHVTSMYLVTRTAGDRAMIVQAVKGAALSIDPDQVVYRVRSIEEILSASLGTRRFEMLLLGFFAALAALLAAVGLYGVLSYTVQARTREIGVRTALGATNGQVFALVLIDAMKLAAIGLAIGLAGAVAVTRVLVDLLFGVQPADPATFGTGCALLFAVAVVAAYVPARRAARVDPMVALRHE